VRVCTQKYEIMDAGARGPRHVTAKSLPVVASTVTAVAHAVSSCLDEGGQARPRTPQSSHTQRHTQRRTQQRNASAVFLIGKGQWPRQVDVEVAPMHANCGCKLTTAAQAQLLPHPSAPLPPRPRCVEQHRSSAAAGPLPPARPGQLGRRPRRL
jgi:hypothetical protein